jgi:type II secretory pathway pseudopilin PulG
LSADRESGLTLLEVVIALLLFSAMSVFLLGGQSEAMDAILRAEVERDMAELLSLRINLVALQWEDYEDGDTGTFPASGASDRLVDEEEIFGDRFDEEGKRYTWELELEETIGSGTTGPARVDDSEPRSLLFSEEGTSAEGTDYDEEVNVESAAVDRLLFIRVTVYPPGYEEVGPDEEDLVLRPRSAWTAIRLPVEGDTE